MILHRGLLALIFFLLFSQTLFSRYLYIDEVTQNRQFSQDIQAIGEDLYKQTGINLYIVMIRELPKGKSIVEYEKEMIEQLDKPAVLLTFSELDSKVDIIARPEELYNLFDKRQVLSPTASFFQKLFMATFYSASFDDFMNNMSVGTGSIIPLLSQKAKKGQVLGKYSGAMFNGYADVAEQIAASKGTQLEHPIGNANKYAIDVLKIIFYGVVFLAIIRYLYIKFRTKKESKNEQ